MAISIDRGRPSSRIQTLASLGILYCPVRPEINTHTAVGLLQNASQNASQNISQEQLRADIRAKLQDKLQETSVTNIPAPGTSNFGLNQQSASNPVTASPSLEPMVFDQTNLADQNLARQNIADQNLANQASHNLTAQNLTGQNLASHNFAVQNLAGQNLTNQNLENQNLTNQNLANQNLANPTLLNPQNLTLQNISRSNLAASGIIFADQNTLLLQHQNLANNLSTTERLATLTPAMTPIPTTSHATTPMAAGNMMYNSELYKFQQGNTTKLTDQEAKLGQEKFVDTLKYTINESQT